MMPSLSGAFDSTRSFVLHLREITLRNAAILAAVMLLIYISFWYYLKGDPSGSMIFSDLITLPINALAVLCLLYAARMSRNYDRRHYYGWLLLFVSQFSFFLGDVFFSYYDLLLKQSTSPSLADIFYLLAYPLFLSGALLLPSANFNLSERIKLLLDTGIVMISSVLIYWSLFIAPAIEQNLGADTLTMLLAVAYPIGDLLLLFALVELFFRSRRNPGADPLLFLGLFCFANIFADAIYMGESMAGTFVSGGPLDVIWIFSYLMLGLAGISHANNLRLGHYGVELEFNHHYGERMWPLYLPYFFAGIAFIMLVYSHENPFAIPFSILSVSVGFIICLVIARQVLVLNENSVLYKNARRLNEELERRVTERTSQLVATNKDLQSQIWERQMAEDALKDSERRLADIINFLPDATFVINKRGIVIAWNRAIEKMTGFKAENVMGKGNHEYSIPFYGKRRPMLIDLVLNSDPDFENTYEALKKQEDGSFVGVSFIPNMNGHASYLLASAAILYDSEGEVYGAIESIRDITERKLAEEDLKSAKERAESATRAKSEFLANMSHEIRTPMNAVIGMTNLLLYENLNSRQKEYAETIRNSGEALLAIINNILDLSKIEGSMMELEHQPFALRDIIEESMTLIAAIASEKGLNTAYDTDKNTPKVILGDPTRLRQILVNLLSNAVKFTEKGEVVISVFSRKLEGDNFEIHFAVKDTGIGVPEDKLGRLFQSFSQVDASTTRRYGGTGLGLVISKKLVEMMGGKIWIESEVGRGSTFHFTIQAESTLKEPVDTFKPISCFDADIQENLDHDLQILLAEDNQVNQIVTQRMLNKLGYRADIVANGIEVLQALERETYDVILMDILMPEMDGLDATKAIRQRWPGGPKIIAMTASALQGDRETCLAAGMDGYISKPTRIEELKAVLESMQQ